MDHDLCVGQSKTLALRACGKQESAHGGSHTNADRRNVALDVLHRVVDGKTGRDNAAGAVDIELNILIGVLRLQIEHLGDDQGGRRVVDLLGKDDDTVIQQAGIDVIRPFAAAGLFDDVGN